jgi:hypothetical protein
MKPLVFEKRDLGVTYWVPARLFHPYASMTWIRF